MSQVKLIALVDDDEVHQFTLKKQIEFTKLAEEVRIFPDGEEAILFFEENAANPEMLPDVLFLDINMPIMDGWDFTSQYIQIKETLSKETAIFMVSSSIREEDIRRAKNIPEIADYIVKPISSQTLMNLIQNLNFD